MRHIPSVSPSDPCPPSTRKRKTVQHSDFEERLPTIGVTGGAMVRQDRLSCRHGRTYIFITA